MFNFEIWVSHRPLNELDENVELHFSHFRRVQTQLILLNVAENRDWFSLLRVELVQDLKHPTFAFIFKTLIIVLFAELPELLLHVFFVEKFLLFLLRFIQINLSLVKNFPDFALC